MLRFAEELMLLILRDDGRFVSVRSWSLRRALAGAVLMDLALEDRIDTDLENLILVDATPLGDGLLDPTLAQIAATNEQRGAHYWVEHIASGSDEIRSRALERLVDKGIVEKHDDKFLWVLRSRRYPTIDGKAVREVKLRIMSVLFSDEIPDSRDVAIIALADACEIFRELLSRQELEQASTRIQQVRNFDLIGQAMNQAIADVTMWLAKAQNTII
ncbi:MAG: GPP34 family phosphoprotein [Acidimicrobiaceae bacterium]|nr:GPP34 family phosphoprotein [Acidimicrobiaceae bacterium]